MRITHLHGFNFRSLDDVAIDLTDDGMIALVGAPGSGKSSLLSLVPFVLYGDTGQNGTLTDLRRRGSDEAERCGGTVTLNHHGDQIQASRWLTRTRPKGKIKETGHASLTINGEPVDGITPTRLTSEITRILGQPKDAFRGANFIAQGEVDTLATATPVEVQGLVEHHTGLAPLTQARKRARETAREAATLAKALPGDLEELRRAEADLDEAQQETAAAAQAADTAAAQRDRAREQLTVGTEAADRLRRAADGARTSRDRLVAARAVAEQARTAVAAADSEVADHNVDGNADDIAAHVADLEGKLQALGNAGAAYKHARADVAHAQSNLEQANRAAASLDREALEAEQQQAQHQMDEAETRGRHAADLAAAAGGELQRLQRALAQLEHAEAGAACCPTCRQTVEDLEGLRAQFQTEAQDCQQRIDQADADRRAVGAAHSQAARAVEQAAARLREVDTAAREIARAEQSLQTATAAAAERADQMRAAMADLGVTDQDSTDGQPLLDAGGDAHRTTMQTMRRLNAAQQAVFAAARAAHALADAEAAVVAAEEGLRDEPDPQHLQEAVAEVQRLQETYDAAVDAAASADRLLSSSQVGLGQLRNWAEQERRKWEDKSRALADAEVAAGTADAISALRSELLAEYTGQISASATELLARFGGEHVAFHLDSDFVPRVELADGTRVDTRTLSGGEKARAGLAFRLGITLQITRGGVPDQVLGDEVTNYLDEDGRRAVIAALQQLFPSVVLISHTSEALDFASHTIALDRDPLGATAVQGQEQPEDGMAEVA